jgi:hypothetical protein
MVGGRLRVGSGRMVSVMVGSREGVVTGVAEFSWVGGTVGEGGEMVALSTGRAVGELVASGTMLRVGDGEEVAVAGKQAVRKVSRAQVRKKRRCMSKLYSLTRDAQNRSVSDFYSS